MLAQIRQSAKSNTKMNHSNIINDNPNMEIMIKKRKLRQSREGNGYDHGVQYYSCNMCEKTFGLPYALVGHKACHYKVTTDKVSSTAAKKKNEVAEAKRHVCKICKEY